MDMLELRETLRSRVVVMVVVVASPGGRETVGWRVVCGKNIRVSTIIEAESRLERYMHGPDSNGV